MKMGKGFWVAHVAAVKFEAISASEYARRHGFSVAALYYWQRKLKSNVEVNEAGQESKFVALRVADQRLSIGRLLFFLANQSEERLVPWAFVSHWSCS
jgi:transposase-like protein